MDYKKLYFVLFNALTDAVEALEAQNISLALDLLKTAQQEAEDLYIESDF